jgi:radical SAM superfamily enzyme YgiQ (UPF0313 family)
MPKVLFIQPTQSDSGGRPCRQRRIYLPGLAFPLLAALTPPEWQVELRIEVVDDIDLGTDADLIGIGTMGHATFRSLELAREFRRRGKTVVLGGYMASLMVDEVLKHADAVVKGDAEIAWPRLLADFVRDGRVSGVYHYPVSSLAGLPVPRYELLTAKPIGGMLPVQAGRGCTHSCSFCSIACLYQGRYLTRPIPEVVRDVLAVRALGVKRFYLIDDNIVSAPRYLRELCDALEPLGMEWATQCSLELTQHPELLARVRRAGATMLSFGVESISQEGVDRLDKSWLRVGDHTRAITDVTRSGIVVNAEMIVGTDGDTEESLAATFDFVMRARVPIPRFYILTPFPGSPLYSQLTKEGRILTDDFTRYTGAECVHRPARLSADRTTELYWWLYDRLFSIPNILRRTLLHPSAWRQPLGYVFAFLVNLHYRKYIKRRVPPNIL